MVFEQMTSMCWMYLSLIVRLKKYTFPEKKESLGATVGEGKTV